MEKLTQRPFRAIARTWTDQPLRFDETRNLKSPTLKPRNPRVTSARVAWGNLNIAVRHSAQDDNQKPYLFLIIADRQRLSNLRWVVFCL